MPLRKRHRGKTKSKEIILIFCLSPDFLCVSVLRGFFALHFGHAFVTQVLSPKGMQMNTRLRIQNRFIQTYAFQDGR